MTAARVLDRLTREPVLLGAATLGTIEAAWPNLSPAWKLALGGWVAWAQRAASKSKRTAAEEVEVARYVGAVEGVAAGPPPPPAG